MNNLVTVIGKWAVYEYYTDSLQQACVMSTLLLVKTKWSGVQ